MGFRFEPVSSLSFSIGSNIRMKVVRVAFCLPVVSGARPDLFDAVDLHGASPDSNDYLASSVDASLEPATKSIADASEGLASEKQKGEHKSRVKREAGLAADAKEE